jgi:hypothetical protein
VEYSGTRVDIIIFLELGKVFVKADGSEATYASEPCRGLPKEVSPESIQLAQAEQRSVIIPECLWSGLVSGLQPSGSLVSVT